MKAKVMTAAKRTTEPSDGEVRTPRRWGGPQAHKAGAMYGLLLDWGPLLAHLDRLIEKTAAEFPHEPADLARMQELRLLAHDVVGRVGANYSLASNLAMHESPP